MKDLSIIVDNYKLNIRVGMIFKYHGKALIEIRKDRQGNSVVPGGRIKIGESSINALIREIKEEMGIKLEKRKIKYHNTIENFFTFENIKFHEIFFIYSYPVDDNLYNEILKVQDNLDNHITEYMFVDHSEYDKVLLLPHEIRNIIDKLDE